MDAGPSGTSSTGVKRKGGRQPNDFVRKYFIYSNGKSQCKINSCTSVLKGQHSTNLERHIQTTHPTEFLEIVGERIKRQQFKNLQLQQQQLQQQAQSSSSQDQEYVETSTPPLTPSSTNDSTDSSFGTNSATATPAATEQSLTVSKSRLRRRQAGSITVRMDRHLVMDALIEMTTSNGRPFSVVEDVGMRRLLDPIVEAINRDQEGPRFTINRRVVQEAVVVEAQRTREIIRDQLKQRLICLKVDTATRLSRSILGVNAQYVGDGGRLVIRNLCVRELFDRHTAVNLKTELTKILAEYGIELAQVYSITTDNARNMIRTVELLSEETAKGANWDVEADGEGDGDGASSDSEEEPTTNAEAEESLGWEWPTTTGGLQGEVNADGILIQRCAAHTLQLAISDALASAEDAVTLINDARRLCKKLRTPIAAGHIIKMGRTKPTLDCETRWHSTLDMIDSLLAIQDICGKVVMDAKLARRGEKVDLTDAEWLSLREISSSLLPAKIATKRLQAEQLVVGDFVAAWMTCRVETEKITCLLASAIVQGMDKREKGLFESLSIASAIFLDPRFNFLLSQEQKNAAEEHLLNLWFRIRSVRGEVESTGSASCSAGGSSGAPGSTPEVESSVDPLERLLARRESASRTSGGEPSGRIAVRLKLRAFAKIPRLPYKTDILLFWAARKVSDPELYLLATTVLAVPTTQVTVERTFSHLKFILSYLRSRLHHDIVNDILLVRCNRIFSRDGV